MPLAALLLAAQLADPRLDVQVGLRTKIAPIKEAVEALGKAGKIDLEAGMAIRDLKVTILVDHMPLGRVMARVADALRLRWEPNGQGYRLVNDPDAASREATFLKAEVELGRSSLEKRLRAMAAASRTPFRELEEEADAAMKRMAALPPNSPARLAETERYSALNNAQSLDNWLQGRLLAALSPDRWNRLLAGEPMSASTKPAPGGIPLPPDAVGYPRWRGDAGNDSNRTRLDVFLRVDPETWALQTRSDQAGAAGEANGMTRSVDYPPGEGTWKLADHPFAKEVNAWEQTEFKDAVQKCDPKTPERLSEWWSGFYSASDQLQWLHDASGIPVVAMATRIPHRRSTLAFAGTVADYLKAWRDKWSTGGYFRMDDGVLMFRPADFWHARRREIPEEKLRPLEASPSPTLDDYADFVARVTDRQAALAGETQGYLLRVSPYAMADGVPALRLWSTLNRPQRNALRTGGALPYRGLAPASKAAYDRAVTDVFAGAFHYGPMSARFTGAGLGSYEAWGILTETKYVQAVGRSRPFPLDRSQDDFPMEPNAEGINIMLGTSKADSVRYTLPLKGLPKSR